MPDPRPAYLPPRSPVRGQTLRLAENVVKTTAGRSFGRTEVASGRCPGSWDVGADIVHLLVVDARRAARPLIAVPAGDYLSWRTARMLPAGSLNHAM